MSISVDSPSDETLIGGPLALLLWRQHEFPFGINLVQFSIFSFFIMFSFLSRYLHVSVCKADHNMVQALLERLNRDSLLGMVNAQNCTNQVRVKKLLSVFTVTSVAIICPSLSSALFVCPAVKAYISVTMGWIFMKLGECFGT